MIEPQVYADERGFFMETYQAARFRAAGIDAVFVQDNQSRSVRGVLRGLHYQEPDSQGKLVRCTKGILYDVAVDIRVGSPNFGKWVAVEISEENKRLLWIPAGFAHGFTPMSDVADLVYKCTDYYSPKSDHSIAWDDPDLAIPWPVKEPQLAPKDTGAPRLKDATVLPRFKGMT